MAYEGRDDRTPDGPMVPAADERGGLEGDLRVQRSEEELRAGVREREAGRVSARKSVHTEREVVRVPKRREEVIVERVPVEGEAREASGATEADIGEDEVVLQVFEEEVVEVDLRKEEVEIRRPDKARDRRCPVGAPRSSTRSARGGLGRWAAWATSS